MKATYRAKYNALRAMNDGHSFIIIKRHNETVSVWLDDIITTPNGEKVQEYSDCKLEPIKGYTLTYRELINY